MSNWGFLPKNVRVGRISYRLSHVLSSHDPFQISSQALLNNALGKYLENTWNNNDMKNLFLFGLNI